MEKKNNLILFKAINSSAMAVWQDCILFFISEVVL